MTEISDSDDSFLNMLSSELSPETFAALQEYYQELDTRNEKLKQNTNSEESEENNTFPEKWQLSQFWYDNDTVATLVKATLKCISCSGKVALISCPTLFVKMKKALVNGEVKLFEFDKRFAVHGKDFIFYNYRSPLEIPDYHNYFDLVIADPPFLSDECLTKIADTVKFLTKNRIILCTGSVLENTVEILFGAKRSKFEPKHKNNLANHFSCFSNFDVDAYI